MRPTSFPAFLSLLAALASPGADAYTPLTNSLLKSLPQPKASDYNVTSGGLLAPLLIPRVPGSEGQRRAQAHLADFFRSRLPQWELLWQNSTATTPAANAKHVPIANLILRREPPWTKRRGPGETGYLTLVAHYDSKREPEGFVGATDSAAPCAVLMDVARAVEGYLVRKWKHEEEEDKKTGKGSRALSWQGVQILFLDGEEAFVSWTDTDSLYGSRSLAEEWESTTHPAMSTFKNPLQQISLFVLLDLLGAKNPQIPSYFQNTHWAYQRMAALEGRLRQLGLLESEQPPKQFLYEGGKAAAAFTGRSFIGDDHVPFMMRGAPVLHLIPSPFPDVWHTMQDDGEHLDIATVKDWTRIVTAFTLEWMDVQNSEPKGNGP
ncbi:hypothetical protein VTJ83DRAFT_2518 [Remersonia thermophila]|uniref:Peptide hydrolase n=1 Tax=Remersonia thermophila TaxID=72144 RepID=A0ABR4DJZ0_9PEZI